MRYFIFGSPHTPPEDIDERDNQIRLYEKHLQETYDKNHVPGGEADDESESEPDEEEDTLESQGVQSVPMETSQTVTNADSLETHTEEEDKSKPEHGHEPVVERAPASAQASLARATAPARRQTGLQQFFQVR